MAHNTRIKPQAGDTVGLTALYTRIGTDIKNCNVLATHFFYEWGSDTITFEAIYFWNVAAMDSWIADHASVDPVKVMTHSIIGIDLDKSIIDQCLDYLLTLPQFNGSQGAGTLVWVKA